MLMPMVIEITGAVPSNFTVNDYTEDCVKVSGLIPLDTDKGGIGRGAEVFNYKTSKDIGEFDGVGLELGNVMADCKVELVKVGKGSKLILREVNFRKPTQPVTPVSTKA